MAKGLDETESAAQDALKRGDSREALTILMDAYGQPIYRHCLSFLQDESLAQDVHQTVFVQAFRDFDKFAGRSTLRTWLFAIARHRCLDAAKKRRRERARWDGTEIPDVADKALSAENKMVVGDENNILIACLQKLSASVRSSVLLRFQDGLSFAEMSRLSGERAGTIQARVARAMPTLRKCLRNNGVIHERI